MCRKNQLWGWILVAFGLGVLVGIWLDGGFLCHCFCIGVIIIGGGVMKKK